MWNTTFSIWHGPISCVTGKYSVQFAVTHGSYVQNNWPRAELFICRGVFVLLLHIIILSYHRQQCTTLYYCKDPNKWIWMISARQDVNLWLWVHTSTHHWEPQLQPSYPGEMTPIESAANLQHRQASDATSGRCSQPFYCSERIKALRLLPLQ